MAYLPAPTIEHMTKADDPSSGRIGLDYVDEFFLIEYSDIEDVQLAKL